MSTSKSSQQTPGGLRPARRSVVKGAAWAVPAVMVASAAPALAASPSRCLTAKFSGDSCKCPGKGKNNSEFILSVCFTNTCSTAITITVTRLVSNSGVVLQPPIRETLIIPPGEERCTALRTFTSTNSANFVDVFFEQDGVEQTPIRLASPPDCDECPGDTTAATATEAPAAETTESSTTTESSSSETTTPATETTDPAASTAPPSEDTTTQTSGP